MNSTQRTSDTRSGFAMEGLEGRQLLSFVFVSSGGGLFIGGSFGSGGNGLVVSVGGGGGHHHRGGGGHHHRHTGVSVTGNFNPLLPATDASLTLFAGRSASLFPTHLPALPLPSFMPAF